MIAMLASHVRRERKAKRLLCATAGERSLRRDGLDHDHEIRAV
jgi:hypothetical protein